MLVKTIIAAIIYLFVIIINVKIPDSLAGLISLIVGSLIITLLFSLK